MKDFNHADIISSDMSPITKAHFDGIAGGKESVMNGLENVLKRNRADYLMTLNRAGGEPTLPERRGIKPPNSHAEQIAASKTGGEIKR